MRCQLMSYSYLNFIDFVLQLALPANHNTNPMAKSTTVINRWEKEHKRALSSLDTNTSEHSVDISRNIID